MFFPLKDLNPTERFPLVTLLIIVANVLVFFYELSLGPDLEYFITSYGAVPQRITQGTGLLTLFTSMFMHGGFVHILGNMVFLWIFGNNIEDILGHARYLFFYLVCGLVAALSHVLTAPSSGIPTVGASGAVAGVLGAYLIVYPRARVLTLVFLGIFVRIMVLPAGVLLVFWFILQMFSGLAALSTGFRGGGVAWFAHIGGFIAGIILIKVIAGRRLRWGRRQGGDDWG